MLPDNREQEEKIESLKKTFSDWQTKDSHKKAESVINADVKALEEALGLWQQQRYVCEKELAFSASATIKFELRQRIQECQQEITRLTEEINLLQQQSSPQNLETLETIDDAMHRVLSRDRNKEETRDAVVTSLRYLIEQPELKQDTVKFVLDTAIDNLNEEDGYSTQPNTQMNKAFYKVLHAPHFAELCYERLLQGFIKANGERRIAIAGIIFYKLTTKIEDLNTENIKQVLITPLINLIDLRSNERARVEVGLELIEVFFKAQIYSLSGRKDFVPTDILPRVIEALFSVLRQDIITQGDNAISHVAIWALGWLTGARYCHFYPHKDKISASQFDTLRAVIKDRKQDPFARSWSSLILSTCAAKTHLFTQEDWIYEWAVIADGERSKVKLKASNLVNFNDPNVRAIKSLISVDKIPIRVKKYAAIALGRLGYFCPEMVEPLLYTLRNQKLPSDERDEALVYLVCIDSSQVISALREGMQSRDSTDNYDLARICFLALNSMGDHSAKEQKRFFRDNKSKFISRKGHLIHKLKAKDSTGRWAYYFVYVEPRNEREFLDALESNQSIDLEKFGKIVGSCYGEQPNDELRALLKNKYGFDV